MLQQTHSVTFWHCQKMQKFYVLKHKHNHAIRVRSLKAPQGVLRVIPWKTWSWSGGDFQRKSIEVTSEEFESVTKHRDLNKSKKVLRIPPVKSKLIFIEHQDIERGLLNHTPTWHTGPPSVRWLRSYIWPSRMEGGRVVGFGLRLRAMIRRWMSKVFSFTALTNPAWLVGDGWEDYMTHF